MFIHTTHIPHHFAIFLIHISVGIACVVGVSILYRVFHLKPQLSIHVLTCKHFPQMFLHVNQIHIGLCDPRHAYCMLQPCVPMVSMSSIIAAICHFVQLTRLHFHCNSQFSRTLGSCFVVCSLCRDRRARCDLFVFFSVLLTSQLVLCI